MLEENIRRFDKVVYNAKIEQLCRNTNMLESGKAAENVVEFICSCADCQG